ELAAAPAPVSLPAAVPAYVPPPTAAYEPTVIDAPPAFSIDGETVALLIWLLGALVCAAFFAVVYLRSRREFNQSLPLENDFARRWLDGHRLRRKISLRQSDRVGAPLTYGVWRPVILMPKSTDWDDEEAVKYVLEHELAHVRRFDAAGKLLLTAAVCLHWFNPLVWGMYVLANRDLELACDEAVLRRLGRETRAEYAMTLIRMAEAEGKNGPAAFYSGFGKSAVEERITAIMKMKKTSFAALLVAAGLVIGVTTVFATSAATADREELDRRAGAKTVTSEETVMSYTDEYGQTWYSTDGGKTFVSEEEYNAAHQKTAVEWWTYDEYAAWLENEKIELQAMLGERGWTGSRGEFVWTQEEIDRTVAMYEAILADIGRGVKVSKTVNGSENTMLTQNPYDILLGIGEGEPTAEDFAEYAPYGLEWREAEKALFYKGERVRYFLDGAYIDDAGGMAVRFEYADAELRGEIDVRALRKQVENGDGSVDRMGPLTGLEKYSQAEFDAHTFTVPALEAEAVTEAQAAGGFAETEKLLKTYEPFGLSWSYDPSSETGGLSMSYNGHPVHALYDPEKGVWIANSLNGYYLDEDAIDLEAVYEDGKLSWLCPYRVHSEYVPVDTTPAQDGELFRQTGEGVTPQGRYASGYVRMSDYGAGKGSVPLFDRYGNVIGSYDNIFSTDDGDWNPPRYLMIKSVGCLCIWALGQDAQGNDIDGYASEDDLSPNTGDTPEETIQWHKDHPEYSKPHDIPLYDESGKVIGTFTISPANVDSSQFSGIDEAKEYVKNLGNQSAVAEGNGDAGGVSFEEKFAKYADFGITYFPDEGGLGNVYYNGFLVSSFADNSPDGGAFTFTSNESGGMSVQTVYDARGKLAGVQVAKEAPKDSAPGGGYSGTYYFSNGYDSQGEFFRGYIRSSEVDAGAETLTLYDVWERPLRTVERSYALTVGYPVYLIGGDTYKAALGYDENGNQTVSGYVRGSDTDAGPDTLEEIDSYLKHRSEDRQTCPLYDLQGNVIGTFVWGGSIPMPSGVGSIDEAEDYLKNYNSNE
ncbi:MAG: M56 family metallopeptidase, partial [Butyricicoccus sp.]|nr:M56 family metallopeptidase [Butyricicoccus sp.]